jgi:MoaA/NifB/PqqE/SkfB family radical SAM enzyme
MSIFDSIPPGLRRFSRKVLPERLVDSARDVIMRRFYLRSMVSREPKVVTWFRRVVLRRKPVLYHFEVHITDHCNLNCRGCAHFSNLCKPTYADLGEFEADMAAMAGHFSAVKQIYLLGGEPLLHKQVAEFVRVARKQFPKTRIYLMTNGTLVTRMDEEFWSALHDTHTILLCDSYPIGLPVDEINELGRTHDVKVEWTIPREKFFKIPIDLEADHDAAASFHSCQGYNNCPIIKDGRIYPCAYIAFADVFAERFGVDGLEATDADSISIASDEDPDKIMAFLGKPVPWCRHCDMESRSFYTWGRSSREISEWTNTLPAEQPAPPKAAAGS